MYVIYKNSRSPRQDSYFGGTWDKAGIRKFYKPTYDSFAVANLLARILSANNPVGFSVSLVLPLEGHSTDDLIVSC